MTPDVPGLQHSVDADGILHVVFDRPGEKVNLLGRELLEGLGRLLAEVRSRHDVQGVLFRSAKPGMFVAGMDVDEIATVQDAYRGAEGARFGQATFQQIAELSVPTACAIGGVCLGGGLELALACDFRLAGDEPAVRIGLPEVKIGIIPGFGGTQRLPRLVGLPAALDLILTGRTLDGRRAKRIGLVDRVVPAPYLTRAALELLRDAGVHGVRRTRSRLRGRRSARDLAVERIGPLRNYVLEQARKRTAARVSPEDYPAPFRALEAAAAAVRMPLPQGLDLEARIVGELVPTATSKNLIWLFKSQTALKSPSGIAAAPRKVRRLAVLGAGIMGGGIAQLAADHDLPVRLKDIEYGAILTALRTARSVWDARSKKGRIDRRRAEQKMAWIAPTLDDTGLIHVDLVIEAVVEDLEVKRKLLAETEQRIGERTVFASNTSSLPIGEIAARALHPERVVGLHFFNPVHRMPLVEVIAGRRSSPEAVATAHALAIRLGKVPVVVRDEPGFLVNRILTLYLFEALVLLADGVPIEAVDSAMLRFGMPMGPFALLDQIGLDTAGHVGDVIQAAFGQRIGGDGGLLRTVVSSGRLGQKNGRGFYRYRSDKRLGPDPEIHNLVGSPADKSIPAETLQERMVLSMVNEAAICLEQGVARQARDVDLAMVLGTGFPPFRGGLLRHADAVGIPIIADRLSRLADAHGERFRPAESLRRMVREQRAFYPK